MGKAKFKSRVTIEIISTREISDVELNLVASMAQIAIDALDDGVVVSSSTVLARGRA